MLAHDGPAVLDVVTATQELSMPPTITAEQIKGFSLWVLRAVMSGRGDEVLDLAKTNLLSRLQPIRDYRRPSYTMKPRAMASLRKARGTSFCGRCR